MPGVSIAVGIAGGPGNLVWAEGFGSRDAVTQRDDGEGALGRRAACASEADIAKLAPHDLRRTCARLCHLAGGELDQIQFLLGHVSIQTTERYLGCKQKLRHAVNDRMGIEPDAA